MLHCKKCLITQGQMLNSQWGISLQWQKQNLSSWSGVLMMSSVAKVELEAKSSVNSHGRKSKKITQVSPQIYNDYMQDPHLRGAC